MRRDLDELMDYYVDRKKQTERFILGFNDNIEMEKDFSPRNTFYIAQEKDSEIYYYMLLDNEPIILLYAYACLTALLKNKELGIDAQDITEEIFKEIDDVYDIDNLTTAYTLEELQKKLQILVRCQVRESQIKLFWDSFYKLALEELQKNNIK